MIEVSDLIDSINRGDFDDSLQTIVRVAREREKFASRKVALTANIGDRVRLHGIRPKALDGATGTVRSRRNTTLMVEIDKEFAYGAGRFSFGIQNGNPLGVPAACIAEIL